MHSGCACRPHLKLRQVLVQHQRVQQLQQLAHQLHQAHADGGALRQTREGDYYWSVFKLVGIGWGGGEKDRDYRSAF